MFMAGMMTVREMQFVLFGIALHLASRSFASYTANSGSFVQYAAKRTRTRQIYLILGL